MSEKTREIFLNPISCDIVFENLGEAICNPNHKVGPEFRENYVLHFIEQGKGNLYINNNNYKLSRGNFFIVSPDILTTYTSDCLDPWVYKWVCFSGENVKSLLGSLHIDLNNPVGKIKNPSLASYYFEQMLQLTEFSYKNPLYIYSNLLQLLSLFETDQQNKFFYRTPSESTVDHLLEKLFYLIDDPLNINNLTVSIISKQLGVSRSYLNKILKQKLNTSVQDLILKKKLARACFLLESTKMNINEISNSLGFSYPSSFTRMFISKMEISPLNYRKKYQNSVIKAGWVNK